MLHLLPLPFFLILPSIAASAWYTYNYKSRFFTLLFVTCYAIFFISLLFGNFGTITYQFADMLWSTHISQEPLATWDRARAVGIFITWAAGLPIFLYLKHNHHSLLQKHWLDVAVSFFVVFYGWMMLTAFFSRSVGL